MKKTLIATCLTALFTMTAQGQDDVLSQFNEIKSHSDLYYWNEYSHTEADTATINSARWVLIEINCALPEGGELTMDDIMPKLKCITRKRGSKTHALSYIRKADVSGISDILATTREDSPAKEEQTRRDGEGRAFVPDVFVQSIARQKDFMKVYQYLKEQKSGGRVLQFGPLKDVEDYGSLDLILFDMESKEIVAMLSPESKDGTRTNQLNGNADSLSNYPEDMLLVIWYIK